MAYDDLDPARLEQLGQLAHGVLCLGDREAVAGHHDDLLGVRQLDRGVVAADLADACRHRRPRRRPATPSPPPKPPTMMFRIERFMASAMSLVRMAPEAPTRAPAMISTGLPITKPAIAAAVPVNEFRRLMTTGMSAPPMGSTMVTPKITAATTIDDQDDVRDADAERRTTPGPRRSTRMSVPHDGDRGQRHGRPGASRDG